MTLSQTPLTLLEGFQIGHKTHREGGTGCTVILCEDGGICGVEVRGSASGVIGQDVASVDHVAQEAQAVLLTGGSAFGLAAVFGVMEYLEKRQKGFDVGVGYVPLVLGAVIFDLSFVSAGIRPSHQWGKEACLSAEREVSERGNVGGGRGATVGKFMGPAKAMKGGLGFGEVEISGGVKVQAVVIVNCLGDVYRGDEILAGARDPEKGDFLDTVSHLRSGLGRRHFSDQAGQNTTIGCLMTNARLEKWQVSKLARHGQNGLARSIRPTHTMFDGDTIFALARGEREADFTALGEASQEAVEKAIVDGVKSASTLGGVYGLGGKEK